MADLLQVVPRDMETQKVSVVFPVVDYGTRETPLSLDEQRIDYLRGGNLTENPRFCLIVLWWKFGGGRWNVLEGFPSEFCVFLLLLCRLIKFFFFISKLKPALLGFWSHLTVTI